MTTVFIGGSRRVSRLGPLLRARLDNIIEQELPIVIGDANGADKAVQQYIHSKNYEHVEVFCSGRLCRNNIGHWPTRHVDAGHHRNGLQFYTAKDRAMTHEATYGFMVWDGKSTGTLLNVLRLLQQNKKVLLYNAVEQSFHDLKALEHWNAFMAAHGAELRAQTERKALQEERAFEKREPPSLLPLTPA